MNAKTVTSAVLVGLWWAGAAARGQEAPAPGVEPPPIKADASAAPTPSAVPTVPPGTAPPGVVPPSTGLSDWIMYRRPDCCSAGPQMPLYSELYLRVGPSVPVGGNYLDRTLKVGWTIEGGVRGLFFDPQQTSAWVIDAGVVNSNNGAALVPTPFPLNVYVKNPAVAAGATLTALTPTIRNFNRTYASLGFGKEWYLWQPANAPGSKWRVGLDAGGRYGASDMTFLDLRHRTDTLVGAYTAAHTDFEIPCGCCFLYWGLRVEWADTWSHRVLQHETALQDLNVLATFGVRY